MYFLPKNKFFFLLDISHTEVLEDLKVISNQQ